MLDWADAGATRLFGENEWSSTNGRLHRGVARRFRRGGGGGEAQIVLPPALGGGPCGEVSALDVQDQRGCQATEGEIEVSLFVVVLLLLLLSPSF